MWRCGTARASEYVRPRADSPTKMAEATVARMGRPTHMPSNATLIRFMV